jgi:hypothetical protein
MKRLIVKCCLAAPVVSILAAAASAQYHPGPGAYSYYAAPSVRAYPSYQYSAPRAYFVPPVVYGTPYAQHSSYYSDDPVKRFWARQERYNRV